MHCLFGFSRGNYALASFFFPILVPLPLKALAIISLPYPSSNPLAVYETFAPTASTASTMSSPSSPTSGCPSDPSSLPQISTMAPRDRSRGRDVYIYDAKDPNTVLGGLILTNGVTNTNLYSMVEILVLFMSDFELQNEGDTKIERNDDPLQPGRYYINAAGKFLYHYIVVLS